MKNVRTIIVLVVFVAFVAFVFYFFSNKETKSEESVAVETTAMDALLSRNMEINYPPTPKEVVKYYSDLSVELYKYDYSDEKLSLIAQRFKEIYDDELVMNQADYLASLKKDIQNYKDQGITISEYSISSSVDVETFKEDGFEWARLYVTYRLRQELKGVINYQNEEQVFLLRKDADGHYKIYGFDQVK